MTKVERRDSIAKKTRAGIYEAQEDYEDWSGGYSLWQAPEYMITTYIARHLSTLKGDTYLTLENNVREGLDDAGGLPPGRPPHNLPSGGRFDILLWHADDPIAVIEVKNRVLGFSKIKSDVARICKTLKLNTSIKCGFIAYYMALVKSESEPAKARVIERVEKAASKVEDFAKREGKKFKRYPGKITVAEDDSYAWTAEVLMIYK